jgi:hypothetical protein
MSNNNTQLPKEVVEEIKKNVAAKTNAVDERLKGSSKDYGRRMGYLDGYEDGCIALATEYATKLLQADKANGSLEETNRGLVEQNKELQRQNDKMKAMATGWRPLLEKVIHRHEGGLLPDRILYLEIKTFLYGE